MNGINITDVRIKLKDKNGMKAICTVVLNDVFVIHDIRIVESRSGKLIVAMPSKKMPDGNYRDICNPATMAARRSFDERILEEYHEAVTLTEELLSLISE